MKIKNIEFPTALEDLEDIQNDNIDVFLELENGRTYNVVVGTPKNIDYLMEKRNRNYFGPGYPFILVKKLTYDIIAETLQAYLEKHEGYWLDLYHFAGDINPSVFESLHEKYRDDSN